MLNKEKKKIKCELNVPGRVYQPPQPVIPPPHLA